IGGFSNGRAALYSPIAQLQLIFRRLLSARRAVELAKAEALLDHQKSSMPFEQFLQSLERGELPTDSQMQEWRDEAKSSVRKPEEDPKDQLEKEARIDR
ncbi:hypothetical protein OKA04_15845, partial [Luteolibacter flavescens]